MVYKGDFMAWNYSHPIHTSSTLKAVLCLQQPPPSRWDHAVPVQKHEAAREALRGRAGIAPVTTALLSQTDRAQKNLLLSYACTWIRACSSSPFPRLQSINCSGMITKLTSAHGSLQNALPDFAFVLPVEQVLPAHPFGHHKLQGRLAGRSGETAQELQEWFQLGVNQVSKHHN